MFALNVRSLLTVQVKTFEGKNWMKYRMIAAAVLVLAGALSCNRDEKSSAERDKEVQRVLQEGSQREQQMYQGMQKGAEKLDKPPPAEQKKSE